MYFMLGLLHMTELRKQLVNNLGRMLTSDLGD